MAPMTAGAMAGSAVMNEEQVGFWKRLVRAVLNLKRCDSCQQTIGANEACEVCKQFAAEMRTFSM